MNFKAIYLTCSLSILTFNAQSLEICGKTEQGQIVQAKTSAKEIMINNTTSKITKDGNLLIAFGRDAKSDESILVDGKKIKLDIKKATWDIQSLTGVTPSKVTPSEADVSEIIRERNLVRAAQSVNTNTAFWEKGFIIPVKGRISGKFGGQRIMNGIKKNPHLGLDIAAPTGTNILSSGDGIITLSEKSLFYSGNVIVVDHGYGLFTIYAHLNENIAKKGDLVKKGDVIGKVGMTGRVTGPHLHWGATLNGIRFNPQSLLNINNIDDNLCFNI